MNWTINVLNCTTELEMEKLLFKPFKNGQGLFGVDKVHSSKKDGRRQDRLQGNLFIQKVPTQNQCNNGIYIGRGCHFFRGKPILKDN